MNSDTAAMAFLFIISAIIPQLVIVGLLLGRWLRKFPEWKKRPL